MCLCSPRTKMIITLILFWTTFVLRKAKWACRWPDNEWFWPAWDSNQGLPSYEPSGQIDLKPKALLSGDTMYIMHDILLYVWPLHHLNYIERFKIILLYYFQWTSICWFLIYFPWWYCADRSNAFLNMGGVRSRKYCASISDMYGGSERTGWKIILSPSREIISPSREIISPSREIISPSHEIIISLPRNNYLPPAK